MAERWPGIFLVCFFAGGIAVELVSMVINKVRDIRWRRSERKLRG